MSAAARTRPVWRTWWPALFLAVPASLVIWKATIADRGPGPTKPLVIIVSGETAGWIVPCGCTSNQSGGLPRRGTLVRDALQHADVIVADAGGAPGGTTPYQRAKFEGILGGELKMGLAAHNLGGPEAALGADYLRRIGSELNVPFISANLRDEKGNLVAEPLRIVQRGERRIAIIGVIGRRFATSAARIDDPRESILRALAGATARFDSLLVLAYLPEEELKQLAANLPEADLVIGGPTGQSIAPVSVGPTLLGSASNKGKFIMRLETSSTGNRLAWSGRVVEMNSAFADDAEQNDNVHRYLERLAREDFRADETALVPAVPADAPKDYRLAGDRSCVNCHQKDGEHWSSTPHARAWQTLSERGSHADPSCQQCHTTGYGLPGGFLSVSRSSASVGVRCESCHGPSLAHSQRPDTHTPFAARDQCVRCHDRENSPKFDYAAFWPQIRHGAPVNRILRPGP